MHVENVTHNLHAEHNIIIIMALCHVIISVKLSDKLSQWLHKILTDVYFIY